MRHRIGGKKRLRRRAFRLNHRNAQLSIFKHQSIVSAISNADTMVCPQAEDVIRLIWFSEDDNGFAGNAIKSVFHSVKRIGRRRRRWFRFSPVSEKISQSSGEGVGKQSITFAVRKREAAAIFQKKKIASIPPGKLKFLYQFARRPQCLDLGRHPLDNLGKTVAFGGGNPGKHGSVAFHADVIQETF